MTITLVDVGTTANDGTGDPLRTAFQTVNTALTRLDNTVNVQTGYVLLKDDGGSAGVVVTTAGKTGIGTTSPFAELDVNGTTVTSVLRVRRNIGSNETEYMDISINDRRAIFHSVQDESAGTAGGFQFDVGGLDGISDAFIVSQQSDLDATFPSNVLFTVLSSGKVGILTSSPTEGLDVNSDAIRVRTSQTPASASATGDAGTVCWDANYIYVCTATNTWKRAALTTW